MDLNLKYQNQYLILPADDGSREDTKLAVEYSDEEIQAFLEQGYVLVSEEDFQKLMGNAEKPYSIRKDGTLYETPAYVPSVEEVQAQKLAEFKAMRDAEEVKPIEYQGKLYDYDEKARERMRIARQALEDNNIPSQTWTCADNTDIKLTVEDFKSINSLAAQRSGQLHDTYRKLCDYIDKLKTADEVNAVTFDTEVIQ